ncbi:hypothetical protein [Kitasatospora sp. NPDC093806]|uniref:hypothetical protein n=1 Tax=Kitasatospora sp. NPDC093806 TaxID=3155075 RepID=UPI00341C7A1F
MQRRSWARGESINFTGYVEVAGPDRQRICLYVVWLGSPGAVPKPKSKPKRFRRLRRFNLDSSGLASDASGLGALLAVIVGLGFLLFLATRWLFIELTGRPHYAVLAITAAAGAHVITHRTRRRKPSLLAAADLADRVERDGAAAVSCPG